MEEIMLDLKVDKNKYDESNPLVLSGTKAKSPKTSKRVPPVARPMSNNKKKKLQKVLERKKKILSRTELLQSLKKVQAKNEELEHLISTSKMQTCGLKKISDSVKRPLKICPNKGANKRCKLDLSESSDEESSSCSETSDSDSDNNLPDLNDLVIFGSKTENVEQEVKKEKSSQTDNKSKISETNTNVNLSSEKEVTGNIKQKEKTQQKPAVFVNVNRKPEIQALREALPIYGEEQAIIEAIKENPVVLIHGETGSGKTTQVPQFLYEAGFTQTGKKIGITEPRRLAAMSMSARVGEELNMPEKVSYYIRYKKNVTKKTQIKFMTDGVLLRELRRDFFLTKYSVIIIDEAHERSVFSDILIGLLSRIITLREKKNDPLKLIIMSATICVEDFMENRNLFKDPPFLIRVESRQYRVQVHFNLRTPEDYVESAFSKICKIHSKLPAGGILVFLTGESEIHRLCKLLKETFPFPENQRAISTIEERETPSASNAPENLERKRKKKSDGTNVFVSSLPAKIYLDTYSIEPLESEELQYHQSDDENNINTEITVINKYNAEIPLHVLPLYSFLPLEEQKKVFLPPPEGSRLCVVSTNVAETSITIPGLKYVVDSGKEKIRVFSENGGVSKFEVIWCSKSSAKQRAGRCGRTAGGHCYRLYSSVVFDHELKNFSVPDIQRVPVDDVVLQIKALGLNRVVTFPFPSPPDQDALKAAERRLVWLGALEKPDESDKWEFNASITDLGRNLAHFPLSPRFAKMLLISEKFDCVPYICAIVCALTVPDLFVTSTWTTETEDGEEVKVTKEGLKKIGTAQFRELGDLMALLQTVGLFEQSTNPKKFCFKNSIRYKAMNEIHEMGIHLLKEMSQVFPDSHIPMTMKTTQAGPEMLETIRKICTTCLLDQVARRIPRGETQDNKNLKNAYQLIDCDEPAFIHPSSTQFERLPKYVAYSELTGTSRLYMKNVFEIDLPLLPFIAPELSEFSSPREFPPPKYDSALDKIYCWLDGTFGPAQWRLPCFRKEMPKGYHRYVWFCYFFLDGQVCPFIKNYRKDFLAQPSTVLKSGAKMLPRTRFIREALMRNDVDSYESLIRVWRNNSKFLLQEFREWIPEEKHLEVELNWPPK